jgi:hypothetical protein
VTGERVPVSIGQVAAAVGGAEGFRHGNALGGEMRADSAPSNVLLAL